ncbi:MULTISPECIES: NAD(P) transhydrogenase subunit alpha [Kribbella]|uniref:proton-translocating NAD(P)(+) transhydrogenase n=1 Tax=Kribbella pratensis TaxID=2512112 RepID=A0A4R8C6C2_9ACTN|nr:NAD(P) transhydrogenase subunit alpha [Kribbella pratensis]TDW70745.1 NAD(P) transhydrogenase subunit alpha [Kribbella pratensis]
MKIAVVRETRPAERRVALVPEQVAKLIELGYTVAVEPAAGERALFSDDQYRDAGAEVAWGADHAATIVASVQPLERERLQRLHAGTALMSFLPTNPPDVVRTATRAKLTAFAMELIPRISRAQSMDALSSQALVAGYRAAIVAAERLPRFFPLNMTAAGTVPPAQVVVLGAGVAGLQAIATAKRLGAVVKAYDVRTAAAEEIASMGAVPIELELGTLDGPGGYAREMTPERAQLQRELLTPYIAAADALITTAAVPGRTAPLLVTRSMVEQMKPGSVVVDLASEQGGNVEGSVAGTELTIGQALVWGGANVPSQMAGPASRLYGQNIANLIRLMTRNAAFDPDFDDEIVRGCCVTHDGSVLHEPTRELLKGQA